MSWVLIMGLGLALSLDEELGFRDFDKVWGFRKHWVDWVLEIDD